MDGATIVETLVLSAAAQGNSSITLDFTATGNNTTVEFVQTGSSAPSGDLVVDNVSVVTTGAGLGLSPTDSDGDGNPNFVGTNNTSGDGPPTASQSAGTLDSLLESSLALDFTNLNSESGDGSGSDSTQAFDVNDLLEPSNPSLELSLSSDSSDSAVATVEDADREALRETQAEALDLFASVTLIEPDTTELL